MAHIRPQTCLHGALGYVSVDSSLLALTHAASSIVFGPLRYRLADPSTTVLFSDEFCDCAAMCSRRSGSMSGRGILVSIRLVGNLFGFFFSFFLFDALDSSKGGRAGMLEGWEVDWGGGGVAI